VSTKKNPNTPPVAALVAGILALLSLLLFIRIPSAKEWLRVSLDASHGPIFAGVAVFVALLLAMIRRRRQAQPVWPDWAVCAWSLAISIALGILIEFLQGFEGRPPSFFDVMTDTAGAMVGLALWTLATWPATGEPRAAVGQSPWPVIALGLAGLVFVLWRPLHVASAYAHRAAAFPVIADFSSAHGLDFVSTDGLGAGRADVPAPWAREPGERALTIRYDPEHPPAVQVLEPQGDWRAYSVIAVDLTNAGPSELSLVLRILDATHDWSHEDRFNLPLVIPAQTRTTVRVALPAVEAAPATRRMDMARIANVMLFGRPPAAPGALYVSRVWLE
jgi:VanZ family protein